MMSNAVGAGSCGHKTSRRVGKHHQGSWLPILLLLCNTTFVGSFVACPAVRHHTAHVRQASSLRRGRSISSRVATLRMGDPEQLFPVLSRIACGVWEGEMRYAGAALEAAPFVLSGTTKCVLEGRRCTLESSVTFPNGKTRTVTMRGDKTGEIGSSFRLDPLDEAGPIYLRLAELAPDTVLLQEFNKTDQRVVLTASISLLEGGKELVQVAHEAADAPGAPAKGFQIWRMARKNQLLHE